MFNAQIFFGKTWIYVIALFLPFLANAQFTYTLDTSISVSMYGDELPMPWAGGINAAQYNTIDLDGDGNEDLVLFDRMANKIITFLRTASGYRYAPDYESVFPSDILNWVFLRDFNCDGKKDLFTGHSFGMRVYENVSTEPGVFEWKEVIFFDGVNNTFGALLTKGSGPRKTNLQIQYDDLPSIVDADGDGDLDIFVMTYPDGGTVEFHKNMSMEKYGTCDSLDYVRETNAWGNFRECDCNSFAFNGEDCNANGRIAHAGGKSLLVLDANGDGHVDIVISEEDCRNLSILYNEGDIDHPIIQSHRNFPEITNVNILNYPAAYFEDVDFDGKKDLMASPNIYVKTYFGNDLRNSNWFYKNTGTNEHPNFVLQKKNFLQDQMIDMGDNAVPSLFDYDNDGDLDLFISNHTNNSYFSAIQLFRNEGTLQQPRFVLVDENFGNLPSMSMFNLKTQLVDMNNDGKVDLFYTGTSYPDYVNRMGYIPNTSTDGLAISTTQRVEITIPNFTFASSENIYVYDVDRDGNVDLLIGKSNGALHYYRNKGSLNFELESTSYFGITSSVMRQNIVVRVADLNGDGKEDLLISSLGTLEIVDNFREAGSADVAVRNIVWNNRTKEYEAKNLGGLTWPVVGNIFSSYKPSIIVGNTLGGLFVLRHEGDSAISEKPVFNIYPNPASRVDDGALIITADRHVAFEIFNSLGQQITLPQSLLPHQKFKQSISDFLPGVYIVRFHVNKKTFARRFVVY
jgi:hypothetical protein